MSLAKPTREAGFSFGRSEETGKEVKTEVRRLLAMLAIAMVIAVMAILAAAPAFAIGQNCQDGQQGGNKSCLTTVTPPQNQQ